MKKNEKTGRKIVGRHLKQEETALLSVYKKSLDNIRLGLSKYYEKYGIEGMLPAERIYKARQMKALGRNVEKEITKLQGKEHHLIHHAVGEAYRHSYYRTGFSFEAEVGGDLGFGMLNPKIVEAAVANEMSLIKWPASSKSNAKLLARRVKSLIEQGIIQGFAYQKVAKQVKEQMEIGATKAMRIIRTETGRAQTEGALKGYDEAQSEGLGFARVWLASLDDRTRFSHRSMDKQQANPETNLFTLPSGAMTQGPHLSGIAGEDINCRCALTAQILDMPAEIRVARDPVSGKSVDIKDTNYDKWANAKKVRSHESMRVICTSECRPLGFGDKMPNWDKFHAKYKGEKSTGAIKYDYYKLKRSLNQKLTEKQLGYLASNKELFEATSINVVGKIKVEPLAIPKAKIPTPTPEVKFSEGVLKKSHFNEVEGWEDRLAQHKAALQQRIGVDFENISLVHKFSPEFKEALVKFESAVKSFTKPIKDLKRARKRFSVNHYDWANTRKTISYKKNMNKFFNKIEEIGYDDIIDLYNNKAIEARILRGTRDGVAGRAYIKQSLIELSANARISTQFHEYAHLMESHRQLRDKAFQWVKKRGHGKIGKMEDISFFSKGRVYKDKFADPYTGKVYRDGYTEVMSTGLSNFTSYERMMGFAKKDFDHFAFIHGIMTGAI